MLNEGFKAGHVNLFPNTQKDNPVDKKPEEKKVALVDEMTPGMLMELMK